MNGLLFWRSDRAKRVPQPVLRHMKERFMLPTLYICSLRCFEDDDSHEGERVRRLRIFSPTLARSFGLTLKKSSDLDEHPEVLLFAGYIDRSGRVYVADRRSPGRRRTRDVVGAGTDNGGNGQGNGNGGRIPRTKMGSYGPGAGWPSPRVDEEE